MPPMRSCHACQMLAWGWIFVFRPFRSVGFTDRASCLFVCPFCSRRGSWRCWRQGQAAVLPAMRDDGRDAATVLPLSRGMSGCQPRCWGGRRGTGMTHARSRCEGVRAATVVHNCLHAWVTCTASIRSTVSSRTAGTHAPVSATCWGGPPTSGRWGCAIAS
jgi:hypothetical protein